MILLSKFSLQRSRISPGKFREVLRCFALDLEATKIAERVNLNRNTVNRYMLLVRKRIADDCEQHAPPPDKVTVVELDESFFSPKKTGGTRSRKIDKGTVVFGLFDRNGRVYTITTPNCSRTDLHGVIQGRVKLESVLPFEGLKGYKKFTLSHGNSVYRCSLSKAPLTRTKNFWEVSKARLAKFKGLNKSTFYLHLKECEFRFNHRNKDLFKILLGFFNISP